MINCATVKPFMVFSIANVRHALILSLPFCPLPPLSLFHPYDNFSVRSIGCPFATSPSIVSHALNIIIMIIIIILDETILLLYIWCWQSVRKRHTIHRCCSLLVAHTLILLRFYSFIFSPAHLCTRTIAFIIT